MSRYLTRGNLLCGVSLPNLVKTALSRQFAKPDSVERSNSAKTRQYAALAPSSVPQSASVSNVAETVGSGRSACFTKALLDTQSAEAEPGSHEWLLRAVEPGKHFYLERILSGSGRRFVSPQAAYAFSLEGGDSHLFARLPAPAFFSLEMASEIDEMYWLSRQVISV